MTATESWIRSALLLFFASELRAWRGRAPLAVVFWGYGVATSLGLVALHATALVLGRLATEQILIAVSAGYTAWILVSIWRCAANAAPFWGTMARWMTVAWGLNSALALCFLQAELLLRYARG